MSTRTDPGTGRTAKDMLLSLLVLLLPLALLAAFLAFTREDEAITVRDPSPAIAQARAAGRFPVEAPQDLATGWRPVSAQFRVADGGATLRIGYRAPAGQGVQFLASDVAAAELLARELGDRARPRGPESIGERTWQRYDARVGEAALVLAEPDRTVIVIGAAAVEALRALAAAVR